MEYLRPRLFEPMGFGDVAWERCPNGSKKGGWGMYVFLEDAVKLGCSISTKACGRDSAF